MSYNSKTSKEVREFLKKYPEFNNKNKRLVTVTTSDSSYERVLNLKRKEEAVKILKNIELYPDEDIKAILYDYYNGESISKLAKKLGKTKKQISRYIYVIKKKVMKFALEGQRVNIANRKKHMEVSLMHKGKTAVVYLVNIGKGELCWVRDDGLILPEEVQELLGNRD